MKSGSAHAAAVGGNIVVALSRTFVFQMQQCSLKTRHCCATIYSLMFCELLLFHDKPVAVFHFPVVFLFQPDVFRGLN